MRCSPLRQQCAALTVALVALSIPSLSPAADFCVTDLTGLETAIVDATTNGASDTIMVAAGIYLTTGLLLISDDPDKDLTLIGGYDPSCTHRTLDPSVTVLDGQHGHQVMYVTMRSGRFLLEGFTIRNGNSSGFGGGIQVGSIGGSTIDVVIRHNIFHDNTAGTFGGAILGGSDLGTFELTNNLIYHNEANSGSGAASLTCNGTAPAVILNNTFADNTSTSGQGGVRLGGSSPGLLANNIFWGNETIDLVLSNPVYVLENNCYGVLAGTPGSSSGNTTADPLFIGGGDYHLQAASTLIDAGTDTPSSGTPPIRDLDGIPRPQGATIDIGAYEWGAIFADGFEDGTTDRWAVALP